LRARALLLAEQASSPTPAIKQMLRAVWSNAPVDGSRASTCPKFGRPK